MYSVKQTQKQLHHFYQFDVMENFQICLFFFLFKMKTKVTSLKFYQEQPKSKKWRNFPDLTLSAIIY